MVAIKFTHFQGMVLFALAVSVAFGFLSRRRPMARLKYIAWSLLMFLLVGIAVGWAMYPFSE